MATERGSTHDLRIIKEVTFGTTPATPTMFQIPLVTMNVQSANTIMQSAQIRNHPFVDRLLDGIYTHAITLDVEEQDATHDALLETFFGMAFPTGSNASIKVVDALGSISLERKWGVNSLYDSFSGAYLDKLSIAISSGDNTPIKLSFTGMAKNGTLDANASIATAVTAADPTKDSFVFNDSTCTFGGVLLPTTSASLDFTRTVNPLNLLGERVTDEFIPDLFTVTGTITVAYRSGSLSTPFLNGTLSPLVLHTGNRAATQKRDITVPSLKITGIGRQVRDRGVVTQELSVTAQYDSTLLSVASIARQ